MENIFLKYNTDIKDKLNNFEKYVRRQSIARFIARYELFKKVKNIKGSIIECGIHHGGGLMAWAKLSSSLEPYAIHRQVFGFDTFEGFPSISENDIGKFDNLHLKDNGFDTKYDIYSELIEIIEVYDESRYLNQFPKIELIKGNAIETIPKFVNENPHILISLLFLDFDLYEPTKVALEHLMPRIPKGGILAFDEINNKYWPGETEALLEKINLNNYTVRKFDFDPNIAYIVL